MVMVDLMLSSYKTLLTVSIAKISLANKLQDFYLMTCFLFLYLHPHLRSLQWLSISFRLINGEVAQLVRASDS